MSVDEQVIRLTLQARGQDTIEALRKSTTGLKSELENLTSRFTDGQAGPEEYRKALTKLGGEYSRQVALLEELQAAHEREAQAAVQAATQAASQITAALQAQASAEAAIRQASIDDTKREWAEKIAASKVGGIGGGIGPATQGESAAAALRQQQLATESLSEALDRLEKEEQQQAAAAERAAAAGQTAAGALAQENNAAESLIQALNRLEKEELAQELAIQKATAAARTQTEVDREVAASAALAAERRAQAALVAEEAARKQRLANETVIEAIDRLEKEEREQAQATGQATAAATAAAEAAKREALAKETLIDAINRLDREEAQHAATSRVASKAEREHAEIEREVAAAADREAQAMAKVAAEMGHVTSTWTAAAAAGHSVAAATTQVTASAGRAGAALDRSTNKMAGAGQAALQTSRAFQDFTQGGLGGIVNNVELITMSLGGSAGLAGAMTALATGALILKPVLVSMAEDFKEFWKGAELAKGGVEELNEEIKKLEDNPIKLTVDKIALEGLKKELDEVQAGIAALKKIETQQKPFEQESGQAVADVMADNRGSTDAVRSELRNEAAAGWQAKLDKLRKQIRPLQEELESQQASGSEGASVTEGMLAPLKEQEKTILKAVMDDAERKLALIVNDATKGQGDDQVNAQKEIADRLRKAGKGVVADSIAGSSPEVLKQQEDVQNRLETSIENQSAGIKDRKEKARIEKVERDATEALKKEAERDAAAAAAKKKTEFDKKNAEVKAQAKLQEQIETKDNATLEKGLGNRFIGEAHSRRLGIEEDQFLTPGQKAKALKQLQEEVRKRSKRQLQANNVDPDEAERLSGKAGAFLDKDLDKQFNQADARFDQADGVEGGNNRQAVAQFVYAAIQQQLAQMAMKGQAPRGQARAPQGARRQPKRGGGMKSVGLGPAAPQQDGPMQGVAQNQAGLLQNQAALSAGQDQLGQFVQNLAREITRLNQDMIARSQTRLRRGGGR